LHKGASGQSYERLKARAAEVNLRARLEMIKKLLDDGNAACPTDGGKG